MVATIILGLQKPDTQEENLSCSNIMVHYRSYLEKLKPFMLGPTHKNGQQFYTPKLRPISLCLQDLIYSLKLPKFYFPSALDSLYFRKVMYVQCQGRYIKKGQQNDAHVSLYIDPWLKHLVSFFFFTYQQIKQNKENCIVENQHTFTTSFKCHGS